MNKLTKVLWGSRGPTCVEKRLRYPGFLEMAQRAFWKSFWPHLFSKRGRRPQPQRGLEVQLPTGMKKKFVFLANFHKVLVKGGPLEAKIVKEKFK